MEKSIFTEEYIAFSPFDRVALRELVKKIEKPFKRIAEIGSWTGNGSTRTIIEEISNGHGILYCIDHWQGNANVARHQQLVEQYDMYETFKVNIIRYGGLNIVKPLVMSSEDAQAIIQNQVFDMIFIDGSHAYDETIQDIDWWYPKIATGGILCGHDCEGSSEHFDRKHLWNQRNVDTLEGNDIFPQIHPGVILAVDDKFGNKVHLWAEEIIELDNGTLGRSTIWDIIVS